ncbi:MAG: hypothetical protein ACT4PX_04795 [Actinomycetota bacterium]
MTERERGQVVPLLAVVIVAAGAVCLVAGRLGGAAVARAQAVTAADAAALAGAAAGRSEAAGAAVANGGRLTRYEQVGGDARAAVAVGPARAVARARRSGGGGRAGVAPALRAALARAEQLLGGPVPAVDPGPARHTADAAARHRRGLAVDVPGWFVPRLAPVAAQAGLCQPHPESHPGHFQLCPPAGAAP